VIQYLSHMESAHSSWNEKIFALDLGSGTRIERKCEHDKNNRVNATGHHKRFHSLRRLSYAATSSAAEDAEKTE
jgi:hypothetical protein